MSKISVKDVMAGTHNGVPELEQEYELYPGESKKMLPPTFELCDKFDKAGWKAKVDEKGKLVRDQANNLVIDDQRAFHEVVYDRCCLIFGEKLDKKKLVMPVAYKAHEDFLAFLRPIGPERTPS